MAFPDVQKTQLKIEIKFNKNLNELFSLQREKGLQLKQQKGFTRCSENSMLELTFSFFLTMLSSVYGEMLFCVNVVVMVLLIFFLVFSFSSTFYDFIPKSHTYVRSFTYFYQKQTTAYKKTYKQTNNSLYKNIHTNKQTNELTTAYKKHTYKQTNKQTNNSL